MVKVINISNKTVTVANVAIKPHKGYLFENVSMKERLSIASLVSVNKIRAYEEDDIKTSDVTPATKENNNRSRSTKTSKKVSKK